MRIESFEPNEEQLLSLADFSEYELIPFSAEIVALETCAAGNCLVVHTSRSDEWAVFIAPDGERSKMYRGQVVL